MVISKMAANMATITLKLAYLLNYLLQISREGVYQYMNFDLIQLDVSPKYPGIDTFTTNLE